MKLSPTERRAAHDAQRLTPFYPGAPRGTRKSRVAETAAALDTLRSSPCSALDYDAAKRSADEERAKHWAANRPKQADPTEPSEMLVRVCQIRDELWDNHREMLAPELIVAVARFGMMRLLDLRAMASDGLGDPGQPDPMPAMNWTVRDLVRPLEAWERALW